MRAQMPRLTDDLIDMINQRLEQWPIGLGVTCVCKTLANMLGAIIVSKIGEIGHEPVLRMASSIINLYVGGRNRLLVVPSQPPPSSPE